MVFNFRKNKNQELKVAGAGEDSSNNGRQGCIVIDGRGYEDETPPKEEIHTLVDVVNDHQIENELYEEIINRLSAIVEKVAREKVPEIAEKLIKEEIQKLKTEQ